MSILTYEGTEFDLPNISLGQIQTESAKLDLNKIWKCPCCKHPYKTKTAMYDHMYKDHSDEIPDGISAAQYAFNIRNHKSFGLCVMCKTHHTPWNEDAERYDRFCSPECRNAYILEAKTRMIKKYGKEHLLNDISQQQKMQDARHIAGTYKFSDGTEITHLGTYELDFLKHCDLVYGWKGTEIMRCPFVFEYQYEGKTHVYMPDYYLPNFNLVVEIKDGGSNPNNHPKIQNVDKVKEDLKDQSMRNQTKYNFIKITNKEYNTFDFVIKAITDMAAEDPDFKNRSNPLIFIP